MFFSLSLIPLTSILSALHGGNWLPKGVCVAIHAALCCGAMLLCGVPWWTAPAGVIPSLVFLYVFRTSRQARAELTAITDPTPDRFQAAWMAYLLPVILTAVLAGGLLAYAKAYVWLIALAPLLGGLTIPRAAVKAFNHVARPDLMQKELAAYAEKGNADRILDCRRWQEIITGAYGGYAVALLVIALSLAIGALTHAA